MMNDDNKENEDNASERGRAAVIFSLKNEVGGLVKALKLFQVSSPVPVVYSWYRVKTSVTA